MKLGIVGYGRMGKAIEARAAQRGHQTVAVFDEYEPLTETGDLAGIDVLIDFSTAAAVLETLKLASRRGVAVVEGTTGWYDRLEEVRRLEGLSCVYSPNFSMGVYQFSRLVAAAAESLAPLGYDVYIHEWHHAGKLDSPSGTAKNLANLVLENFGPKTAVLEDRCDRQILPHELHVSSTRVGRIPGTHRVGFDSGGDSILLEHTAHGRDGFVEGSLEAAEWIRRRKGLYSMDDFMNSYAGRE